MIIEKVISGGQTGADQGGLEAARSLNIPTGGTAPYNFMTEMGARRGFLESYGLVPGPYDPWTYPVRTRMNVEGSDGTVWFGRVDSPGYQTTIGHAGRVQKPFIVNPDLLSFVSWLRLFGVKVLNVAGNRESGNPGIRERVKQFLRDAMKENA